MDKKELRIGNMLRWSDNYNTPIRSDWKGKLHNITLPDFKFLCYLEPVRLTEEKLVEFGFDKLEFRKYPTYRLGVMTISLVEFFEDDEVSFKEWKLSGLLHEDLFYFKHGRNIDYIHQLQNLYYALTNKELDIKL